MEFIDKVEDFLEKGSELNNFKFSRSSNGKVYHLSIGRESLTLCKYLVKEIGVLNGEVGYLPMGFVNHVISTLKPTEI